MRPHLVPLSPGLVQLEYLLAARRAQEFERRSYAAAFHIVSKTEEVGGERKRLRRVSTTFKRQTVLTAEDPFAST